MVFWLMSLQRGNMAVAPGRSGVRVATGLLLNLGRRFLFT